MSKISLSKILLQSLPVSSLKSQAISALVIGLSIFLILSVFQPFGTYEFHRAYKFVFLAGYGVIFAVVYLAYFFLTMRLFKFWFHPAKWNLVKEVVTMVPLIFLISYCSLLYHNRVIGGYVIRWIDVFYFFRLSIAVGIIPFFIVIYRKWMKAQLITVESEDDNSVCSITFESNNKKEKPVTISSDKLLYIKSDGNYLDIFEQGIEKPRQIRNSLNYVESKLTDKNFMRIHRSFIVNKLMMDNLMIDGSAYNLRLKNGDLQLPVSRAKVKEIRDILA